MHSEHSAVRRCQAGERRTQEICKRIKKLVLAHLARHRQLFKTKERIEVLVVPQFGYAFRIDLECTEEVFCEEQKTLLRTFFTEQLPGSVRPILEVNLGWEQDRIQVRGNPRNRCCKTCSWVIRYNARDES